MRPVEFFKDEMVCFQGDEATDMYIVIGSVTSQLRKCLS